MCGNQQPRVCFVSFLLVNELASIGDPHMRIEARSFREYIFHIYENWDGLGSMWAAIWTVCNSSVATFSKYQPRPVLEFGSLNINWQPRIKTTYAILWSMDGHFESSRTYQGTKIKMMILAWLYRFNPNGLLSVPVWDVFMVLEWSFFTLNFHSLEARRSPDAIQSSKWVKIIQIFLFFLQIW